MFQVKVYLRKTHRTIGTGLTRLEKKNDPIKFLLFPSEVVQSVYLYGIFTSTFCCIFPWYIRSIIYTPGSTNMANMKNGGPWMSPCISYCNITLPETNIVPENGCLEYDPFLLGSSIFRGELLVSGRVRWFYSPAILVDQRVLVPVPLGFLAAGCCLARRLTEVWCQDWRPDLVPFGAEEKKPTNKRHNLRMKIWVVVSNFFLIFTPNLGEDSHFDDHIFQMGWNYQREMYTLLQN